MVKVTIRLAGEEDEQEFTRIELDPQIHIDDLKEKIERLTRIPPTFQEIKLRSEKLPATPHPLESIKEFDELVVRHSEIRWWDRYRQKVDIALNPGRERIPSALEAVKIHKQLMDRGFFDVYSSFDKFRMEHHHMIASWTDESLELMKEAATSHFRAKHFQCGADDESDFTCRFEDRPEDLGGSRKGTLAFVQLHNEKEETKYNLKCHHYAISSGSLEEEEPPDVKELYGYKVLELIRVGPRVEFILPKESAESTTTSMYIATQWNENFVPLSRMGKAEDEVSVEILVQILLLGTILQIEDLHADNCGMWRDTGEVAIVDFMPSRRVYHENAVEAFLYNNHSYTYWEKRQIEALERCDETTRLAIATKSLAQWDLLSKVDLVYEQIVLVKNNAENQGIRFRCRRNPTKEFELYMRAIKNNLAHFNDISSWRDSII